MSETPRKFRGINLKFKTWAYGYYVVIQDRHYIAERDVEFKDVVPPCPESGINGMTEVIPETVGQFIGITDKTGKEIYGGDIIKGTAHDLERYSEEKRPDLWSEYIVRFGRGEVDASDHEQYEVEIIGFYLEKVKPDNWAADSILRLNGVEVIGNINEE